MIIEVHRKYRKSSEQVVADPDFGRMRKEVREALAETLKVELPPSSQRIDSGCEQRSSHPSISCM